MFACLSRYESLTLGLYIFAVCTLSLHSSNNGCPFLSGAQQSYTKPCRVTGCISQPQGADCELCPLHKSALQSDCRRCACTKNYVLTELLLQMIHRLGKEIGHPDSIYYWAYKHNIPVYCPALTDGSLGDMLYFHTFKNPGLVLDIIADIRSMNDEAMKAPPRKTGVIILGGGMLHHHHVS